jgi:hypothetical protein
VFSVFVNGAPKSLSRTSFAMAQANYRHGRDGKVFAWQFKDQEEGTFNYKLPSDGGIRRKPWLLHSLDVKEMTFCGMDAVCTDGVSSILYLF